MYKDYYSILELSCNATHTEIKKSYRTLAKKWHPDINKSQDATSKMQEITEAYLILNDPDARKRYDKIHEFYFRQTKVEQKEEKFEQAHRQEKKDNQQSNDNIPRTEKQTKSNVQSDPILDDWILKAKQQAKEFVRQSLKDAKGITVNGCRYTAYAIGITLLLFIVILMVVTVIKLTR